MSATLARRVTPPWNVYTAICDPDWQGCPSLQNGQPAWAGYPPIMLMWSRWNKRLYGRAGYLMITHQGSLPSCSQPLKKPSRCADVAFGRSSSFLADDKVLKTQQGSKNKNLHKKKCRRRVDISSFDDNIIVCPDVKWKKVSKKTRGDNNLLKKLERSWVQIPYRPCF